MADNWKKSTRGKALLVIEAIFDQGAYTNIALNQQLSNKALSAKDRALLTEIVYGTVSRKISLEWYLAHYVKDRDKLDKWVYYLLMLSLYQLTYLDKLPAMPLLTMRLVLPKIVAIKKVQRSLSMLFYVNSPAILSQIWKQLSVEISIIRSSIHCLFGWLKS